MSAHLVFDGTNYLSTPDINKLDADTAHCQQSAGGWIGLTLSTDLTPSFGDYVAGRTTTTAGNYHTNSTPTGTDGFPISASTQHSVTVDVGYLATVSGEVYDIRLDVQQYDVGGSLLATTILGAYATYAEGSLHTISGTFTSHASAAFARLIVYYRDQSGGRTAGDYFYVDAVCLREGSDASFVRSLRILGDLDWEMDYTPTLALPSSNQRLFDMRDGNYGINATHSTAGTITASFGDGLSTRTETFGLASFADRVRTQIRCTAKPATGDVTWYQDGVATDSDSFAAGALAPAATALAIGSTSAGTSNWLDGSLFSFTLRDGIGGPVVASFYADDIPSDLAPGETFIGRDSRVYTAGGTNPIIKIGGGGGGGGTMMGYDMDPRWRNKKIPGRFGRPARA